MKTRLQALVVTLVAISLNQAADASNLPMANPSANRPVVPRASSTQTSQIPAQIPPGAPPIVGQVPQAGPEDHSPIAAPGGLEEVSSEVGNEVVPTRTSNQTPVAAPKNSSSPASRMTSIENFADAPSPEQEAKDRAEAPLVPIKPEVINASKVSTNLIKGEFEKVVCISEGTLAVRSSDLKRTLFVAKRGEKTKVFQGWGDVKKQKKINGHTFTFIKVQIERADDRDANIGWVADSYVKAKSACPMIPKRKKHTSSETIETDGAADGANDDAAKPAHGNSGKGLSDPDCCGFPIATRPTNSFLSGNSMFSAGRQGGKRKHAACDLYLERGASIKAVAGGKVVRGLYYFYQGTYALEVKHAGGFVVRYGEITGKKADNTELGADVKSGQQVGSMGKVNSNCCEPMLHFELYKGDKTGPLSQGGRGFRRRSDLINPTDYLLRWQENL